MSRRQKREQQARGSHDAPPAGRAGWRKEVRGWKGQEVKKRKDVKHDTKQGRHVMREEGEAGRHESTDAVDERETKRRALSLSNLRDPLHAEQQQHHPLNQLTACSTSWCGSPGRAQSQTGCQMWAAPGARSAGAAALPAPAACC